MSMMFSHTSVVQRNFIWESLIISRRYLIWPLLLILFGFGFYNNSAKEIDQLFQAYGEKETPGAAVMVIKNGKPIFKKAYGLANLEEQTPVKLSTNFRLASVTKQFTAMCIMKLVERGQLNYERNLQEVFPEFPSYGRGITIRHLLLKKFPGTRLRNFCMRIFSSRSA